MEGSLAPLEESGGALYKITTMSRHDAQAQQANEPTVAAEMKSATTGATETAVANAGSETDEIVDSAKKDLASDDEDACMAVMEQSEGASAGPIAPARPMDDAVMIDGSAAAACQMARISPAL